MSSASMLCPSCKAKLRVESPLAGQRLKCPRCGAFLKVRNKTDDDADSFLRNEDTEPLSSVETKTEPSDPILVNHDEPENLPQPLPEPGPAYPVSRPQHRPRRRPRPVVVVQPVQVHTRIIVAKSAGTAAVLELVFGMFFHTFGIGHIYAGNVVLGLFLILFSWAVLAVNLVLLLVGIGIVTLPCCWLIGLIVSPLLAALSCQAP